MRPYQVWRHTVGTPATDDVLVFEDPDERYYVAVDRTRTGRYIVITSASKLTTEVWFVDAGTPSAELRVVAPREEGVEYHVEHHVSDGGDDRFYVLTNADGAENFALMVAPVATPGREHWTTVVPHRPDVRLEDVDAFAHHLVLSERGRGLEQIHVLPIGSTPGATAPASTSSRCRRRCTRSGRARTPSTGPRPGDSATRRWSRRSPTTTTTPRRAP